MKDVPSDDLTPMQLYREITNLIDRYVQGNLTYDNFSTVSAICLDMVSRPILWAFKEDAEKKRELLKHILKNFEEDFEQKLLLQEKQNVSH